MSPKCKQLFGTVFGVIGLLVASSDARAGSNLVVNGNFSTGSNGMANTIGEVGQNTTLQAWYLNGANPAAVDVANQNYDSSGVPIPTPSGTVYGMVWGPGLNGGTGPQNGFTGPPGGGKFHAADADYEVASVNQNISGLTVGQKYALSFEWAGAQAYPYQGTFNEWWNVSFGGSSQSTTAYYNDFLPNVGEGFSGWSTVTFYFTATSAMQTLTFTPEWSNVLSGMPPVLLLDNVQLSSVPEPSSVILAIAGTGFVVGVSWIRRRKAKPVS
jgi:hypothetical protein